MSAKSARPEDPTTAQARGLLFWILGRMAVTAALLGGTLLFALDGSRGYRAATSTTLVVLIVASFVSSLVATLRLSVEPHDGQRVAAFLLAVDVVAISALVYVTGGAGSVFTILYGATVLMGAVLAGPVAARIAALTCVVAYACIGVGLARGILPHPSDQSPTQYIVPSAELFYAIATNVIGLLAVSLLATNLAARLRQAGGALEIARRSVRKLGILNDDIVRSIASGLMTTDLDGRVQTVNPAGLDMFGHARSSLLGRPIETLFPDAPRERARAWLVDRAESDARRPDGSAFPVGYSVSALLDEEGRTTGSLVTFQDLTEIKRLENRARQQEDLASLGRLSAGLAHEIRNPLSSISGAVELVRENPRLDPEDHRLLGIVLRETERLNDLVTTMLNVAKPRRPRPLRADLRTVVNEVATMARAGLVQSASVEIDVEGGGPVPCLVDVDQIRQVVWNLVKNAVQASPPESVIRLRCGFVDADTAFLDVEDEGAGLDGETTAKLFDMFYSGRTHGVGIGLALVKQIVDAHQGRVKARNVETGGAIFHVELPVDPGLTLGDSD